MDCKTEATGRLSRPGIGDKTMDTSFTKRKEKGNVHGTNFTILKYS